MASDPEGRPGTTGSVVGTTSVVRAVSHPRSVGVCKRRTVSVSGPTSPPTSTPSTGPRPRVSGRVHRPCDHTSTSVPVARGPAGVVPRVGALS